MAVVEISRIQVRRGQENQTGVPVLDSGEFGWATDTENLYIGLRRIDGGSRDANVRILTENDLRNILRSGKALGSLGVDNTNYTFQKDSYITSSTWAPPNPPSEVIRTLQSKLDDFVNLKDFLATGTDITLALELAITKLTTSTSLKKVIYIPAGEYQLTDAMPVPAYTRIVGEGMDNTKITMTAAGLHFFETVDGNIATGTTVSFDSDPIGMGSTLPKPEYISIENLTLYRNSTSTTGKSFIALDNTRYATIKSVKFQGGMINSSTVALSTTTLFTGVEGSPTGIEIRSNTYQEFVGNINIEDCHFSGMFAGIKSNHDLADVLIDSCSFYLMKYGIYFNSTTTNTTFGPRHVKITNNEFNTIYAQGLYAGPSLHSNPDISESPAHIVSQNNRFTNVANYFDQTDEQYPTTGTSIIFFGTNGNLSQNDYFNRDKAKIIYDQNSSTYYPLVDGRGVLDYTVPIAFQVTGITAGKSAFYIPITGNQQHVRVKYYVYEESEPPKLDRSGVLDINVGNGANPLYSISDDYSWQYNGLFPVAQQGDSLTWANEVRPEYKYIRFYIYNPRPEGSGAQFDVSISPLSTLSGTYSNVTLSFSGGTNYQVNDIIKIPGTYLSSSTTVGQSPLNDLFVTVTGTGTNYSITSFTWTGTAVTTTNIFTITNVTTATVIRQNDPGFGFTNIKYIIQPSYTFS